MKSSESIQKFLPFGYLFLVVMGILKESVFYYQIGINILKYSTIMDILISPIATLTANPVILIVLILLTWFSYSFPAWLSKQNHKKWTEIFSALKNKEVVTEEEIGNHFTDTFIKLLAAVVLSFFIGIGFGEGLGLTKRIKNNKLEYDRKLTFNSGESEPVYLISSNSIYYFYLSKANKSVKIAPIGAIKNIELTNNKMLTE